MGDRLKGKWFFMAAFNMPKNPNNPFTLLPIAMAVKSKLHLLVEARFGRVCMCACGFCEGMVDGR